MRADAAMTASRSTAVGRAFAARVLAQVTKGYATGTAGLTVRLSRGGPGGQRISGKQG
jgi:hypothetical protein